MQVLEFRVLAQAGSSDIQRRSLELLGVSFKMELVYGFVVAKIASKGTSLPSSPFPAVLPPPPKQHNTKVKTHSASVLAILVPDSHGSWVDDP